MRSKDLLQEQREVAMRSKDLLQGVLKDLELLERARRRREGPEVRLEGRGEHA